MFMLLKLGLKREKGWQNVVKTEEGKKDQDILSLFLVNEMAIFHT